MNYQAHFQVSTTDLFGCVSPWLLLQEVNDCLGYEFQRNGVAIQRMLDMLDATWMMGQMVMECTAPIHPGMEIEIEMLPWEQHGVGILHRARLRDEHTEYARMAMKMLPVYVRSRKVVPPRDMAHMWLTPAAPAGEPVDWVRLPENMELAEQIRVRRHMCDVNGHMTAFQYLNYICETAGYWEEELHLIRRLQVDFKAEFLPEETLELYRGEQDGVVTVSGRHADGRVGFNACIQLSPDVTPSYRGRMSRCNIDT